MGSEKNLQASLKNFFSFFPVFRFVAYFTLFLIGSHPVFSNPRMESIYRQESIKQGTIQITKAQEYFQDRLYDQCIQTLNHFSIVYPFHPDKIKAWDLLSRSYSKLGKYQTSADIDLNTYLEYPTWEEANKIYLRAGRTYTKLGNYDMAKRIFNDLRESSFFPKIAEEADLELRQWSVLSGNTRQNQENL